MVFLGTFGAYLVLFLAFVACAGLAVFGGITLRKSKNKKATIEETVAEVTE